MGGGALGLGLLVPHLFYRLRKPSWKTEHPEEVATALTTTPDSDASPPALDMGAPDS